MSTANGFSHGTGILVKTLGALETLASGGLMTITLPKNAHDVAFVNVIRTDDVLEIQSATTWTAKVVAQAVSSGVITEGYVVFEAWKAYNPGTQINVLVVL
jgi:hypothetical protein